jgi:hypothetical protein
MTRRRTRTRCLGNLIPAVAPDSRLLTWRRGVAARRDYPREGIPVRGRALAHMRVSLSGVQDAAVRVGIAGITGHVEHSQFRAAPYSLLRRPPAAHLRHGDIRNQEMNQFRLRTTFFRSRFPESSTFSGREATRIRSWPLRGSLCSIMPCLHSPARLRATRPKETRWTADSPL